MDVPTDPGEGWRFLNPDELLADGDQWWAGVRWAAISMHRWNGKQNDDYFYRRQIHQAPKPPPTVAKGGVGRFAGWPRQQYGEPNRNGDVLPVERIKINLVVQPPEVTGVSPETPRRALARGPDV